MWTLKQTSQFKKDLKRWEHKPQKMKSLLNVLEQLAESGAVDESEKVIKLIRLGTHSELFR